MKIHMKIFPIFWLSIFLLSFNLLRGQETKVQVQDENRGYFPYPWAGGMNSCQFGEMDLNMDGKKDLVVFDRMGNRLMTFLNQGSPGNISYTWAPEYQAYFPEISDWIILKDYNGDGKEDIFTYSPGYAGMKVYKNVSSGSPEFQLVVYPYLKSFQGGGYVNILSNT